MFSKSLSRTPGHWDKIKGISQAEQVVYRHQHWTLTSLTASIPNSSPMPWSLLPRAVDDSSEEDTEPDPSPGFWGQSWEGWFHPAVPCMMETAYRSCMPVCYKTDTKGSHTTITGYEINHVVRLGAFINTILKIPYDVI